MMEHVWYKCPQPCEKQNCQYCDGGLQMCTVCGQAEGDLEPECPGPNRKIRERSFYATQDPENVLGDKGPVPAMTTLLYKVCGNDPDKFHEATRLIGLIVDKALEIADQERPGT